MMTEQRCDSFTILICIVLRQSSEQVIIGNYRDGEENRTENEGGNIIMMSS
jgi:hypothetical protein